MSELEKGFDHLDDDGLDDALEAASRGEDLSKFDEVVEEQPDPGQEDAVVEEEAAVEEEVAPEEAAAEATEEVVEEAKSPEDDGVDDEVTQEQLLQAQLDEEAKSKAHWKEVADRNAGRLGFLERQISEMSSATPALASPNTEQPAETVYDDEIPVAPVTPRRDVNQQNTEYLMQLAIKDAQAEAIRTLPDFNEMGGEMAAYIQENAAKHGYDIRKIASSGDPVRVKEETLGMLSIAYRHVDAQRAAKRRAELTERFTTQTKRAGTAKQKAAMSSSGGTPPPRPVEKTQGEMTDEELESALARETKGAVW